MWGYDIFEKNHVVLSYKRKEFENTQNLIKKTEGMLE